VIRYALSALAVAFVILTWSIWSAWRVAEPAPSRSTSAAGGVDRDRLASGERYDLPRVLAAVNKDPFHPNRRRPAVRFVMPGDAVASSAAPVAAPPVRVIGTAVSQDGVGGFAMCSLGTGTPRIVRVGERLGDWTLSKVTPGAAEFATASGSTVIVRIAKAGGGT